ncbi:MAG TPA: DMT family transporter, partial [Longimicrobium sp.]|nr:DMT family transporter [Longimicrobium sp.]
GAAAGNAPTLKGDLLTLGCAVAYAIHLTLTSQLAARSQVTAMVAVQLWGVALLSSACLPFTAHRVEWNASLVGGLLFTGLVASAFAINVQSWGQARTTAVRAALIFSTEPVFAVGYSALFINERLGPMEWVGGGLIVAGIVVAEVGAALLDRYRPAPPAAPSG